MFLFTIVLWACMQSPGSAFIIIYTNDRNLGQWEAEREIQPSHMQLLWILCKKKWFVLWQRHVLLSSIQSRRLQLFLRRYCIHYIQSSHTLWLFQKQFLSEPGFILRLLMCHVLKVIIHRKRCWKGASFSILDPPSTPPSLHSLS